MKPALRLWEVRDGKAFRSRTSAGKGTAFALVCLLVSLPGVSWLASTLPGVKTNLQLLVHHAHLCTVWFLPWCAALLLHFQPALTYTQFFSPLVPREGWARSEPGRCRSMSLNTVSKWFEFKYHQVKQTRGEKGLWDWEAGSKAGRGEPARQSPAAAAEAEEEREPGGSRGDSRSFRGKGGKPRQGWPAGSRALPAPPWRGAGSAWDFSTGVVLQGWGLEWKATNRVRRTRW